MKLSPSPLRLTTALFAATVAATMAAETSEKPSPEQLEFFEKKIRPVLSEHCYQCHSERAERIRGGLVLDTREGIRRGGDNGPAVVPGDLKESLLIEAIHHTNKDFTMPPETKGGKLPDAVVRDFEEWVKMGAPDPRDGAAKVVAKYDDAAARKWWSFQPLSKPAVPAPQNAAWAKSDIDRFILAGLEQKGLAPVADADRATLLRRVYFDLIGLPPSPQELTDFLADTSADAFEKVVDRLLASPQFGERWGRHWLDVARYAESSGKDVNVAFPHAWRYRDYVIASFNADKSFDDFIREQIAGDLLPYRGDRDRAENLIATGFLAIGPKGLNELNPRQFAMDLADEQIDTVSQAVLGLTVACARCHDHKFDPISQRDYYGLAGIFLSTETRYGTGFSIQNRFATELIELPRKAGAPIAVEPLPSEARERMLAQLDELKDDLPMVLGGNAKPRDPRDGPASGTEQVRRLRAIAETGALRTDLKAYDEDGTPKPLAMGVVDRPAPTRSFSLGFRERFRQREGAPQAARFLGGQAFPNITDSPLLARGDVNKPGETVPRGFPALLTFDEAPKIPAHTSGRLELAEWLVTPSNPLTSRVIVNRAWHWLFGRGLVESVDNFGTTGQKPSNPALLDHLAQQFIADDWSMKRLVRSIVLSRTYQLGSSHDARAFAADPQNTLHWRMSPRRLDAECVRDAMLAASGQLKLEPPTGSIIAREGDGELGGLRGRSASAEAIVHANGNFRSVYLPIARAVVPDALAVFDFAETSLVTGARETTNVPSQALYLLNSTFVSLQAQAVAERVLKSYPAHASTDPSAYLDERLTHAWQLVFARTPRAEERTAAAEFLRRFPNDWQKPGVTPLGMRDADAAKAAWTSLCRALFASAEFRYLD